MKFSVILFVFLLPACPFIKSKKSYSRRNQPVDKESPYEKPPHPPIPPEQYCYELRQGANGGSVTRLELTVTLDSVEGKLQHIPPRQDEPDGFFIGTLYDSNMLVSYQYNLNGKSYAEDQQWKLFGDSIYRKNTEIIKHDSTQAGIKDSVRIYFSPALHKAPCI